MPFFNTSSYKEPALSMETFREWAGAIANGYFTCGTPPTELLCKIASTEELTPHQVEVLAGEVNKAIHTVKHASAKDKYLAADFPLADSKEALKSLQGNSGMIGKFAVEIPRPVCNDTGPDAYEMWGITPQALDKTASLRAEMNYASQKTAMLRSKLSDKALLSKYAAEKAEEVFIKEARQHVLEGQDSEERLLKLAYIHEFTKLIDYPEAKPMLAKLAYVLGREGMLEPLAAKIASECLSKGTNHPLLKVAEHLLPKVARSGTTLEAALKTFRQHRATYQSCAERGVVVDDRLGELGQRLRVVR